MCAGGEGGGVWSVVGWFLLFSLCPSTTTTTSPTTCDSVPAPLSAF